MAAVLHASKPPNPPPVDVTVEKIDGLPLVPPRGSEVGPALQPPPTVIG